MIKGELQNIKRPTTWFEGERPHKCVYKKDNSWPQNTWGNRTVLHTLNDSVQLRAHETQTTNPSFHWTT